MIEYFKATENDIDELVILRMDFLKEAQGISDNKKDKKLTLSLKNYFIDAFKKKEFISWIAKDNNNIIATSGMCFYTLPPSYKNITGKIGYIMNMYTKPDYRRRGIASDLFKKLIDEADKLGILKLSLHATDAGKPVYLKQGFTEETTEMKLYLNK